MKRISTPSHVARDLLGAEFRAALRCGFGVGADLDGRASRPDRDPALVLDVPPDRWQRCCHDERADRENQ